MAAFARSLDRILRGETSGEQILTGGTTGPEIRQLVLGSLALGALYGVCMGVFALGRSGVDGLPQLIASTLKVPLLFLLTLGVTFPSLYVFSALAGSRIGCFATLRLILVAITVNVAVLSSLGPVTVFFSSCTASYPFIKLLHVLMFVIAGVLSLAFLRKALAQHRWVEPRDPVLLEAHVSGTDSPSAQSGRPPSEKPGAAPNAIERDSASRVLRVWIFVYGVVGAQMGWVLRPFLGSPDREFQWFRPRNSSFFANVLESCVDLFS